MKKILVIEDDAPFAGLIKGRFGGEYEVEICADGQSGFFAIYEFKPDLVLLDVTIEHMDALSLIGKMRVQKQFQKLPIFILGDSATLATAEDALAAGANEIVLKDENGAMEALASGVIRFLKPSLVKKRALTPEPAMASVSTGELVAVPRGMSVAVNATIHPSLTLTGTRTIPWLANTISRNVTPVEEEGLGYQPMSRVQGFLDTYGRQVHTFRHDFIRYRTAEGSERPSFLASLLSKISTLNADAVNCGLLGLGRYLSVLEFRVQQFLDSTNAPGAASLQGLASALDILAALSNHLAELEPLNHLEPQAMVVDDENVSRRALCLGLEKAKIKTVSVDSPCSALLEAEGRPFDLFFLDVDLPKMNGFALCARLRIIPAHRKTPVIFVTALNDVRSRASSRVSGGNDFITKPVNLSDIGINAWSLILGKRILESGHPVQQRA